MPEDPVDIVILDEPPKHAHPRWHHLTHRADDSPRFGLVGAFGVTSLALGVVALLTSLVFFCLPILSVPFSVLGLVFGGLSVFFSISRRRLSSGLGLAVLGLISSLFSLAIAVGMYYVAPDYLKNLNANSPRAPSENARLIVGKWQRPDNPDQTVEFTKKGNVIVRSVRGDSVREEMGSYGLAGSTLLLSDNRGYHDSKHKFELINANELFVGESPPGDSAFFRVPGRWYRAEPLPEDIVAPPAKSEYERQLDELKDSRSKVAEVLKKYEADKFAVVTELKGFKAEDRDSDRWKIRARELKILVDQISFLTARQAKVDQAILRLETVIRSEMRQGELTQLGITEEEVKNLSVTVYELDDDLEEIADVGPAADLELEAIVKEQIGESEAKQ